MSAGVATIRGPALISIVIPSRNRASLLARALAGIQAQTCSDYEVIVVDDGSDEATRTAYQHIWSSLDARFRLALLGQPGQPGLGPSVTRNHGIALSKGEWLAFCDDDDFWCDADHLADVLAAFAALPTLDVYMANQRAVQVDGGSRSDWLPQLTQHVAAQPRCIGGAVQVSVEELCRSGGFGHLNMLSLRKSLVTRIHGFWERVSYEEDRDFFWRAVDGARQIVFNPRVVAQHNVPDPQLRANASTAHSRQERGLLAALVCQHIATSVRHPAIAALAMGYSGDLLRHLSMGLKEAGQRHAALYFARQALAARYSFKWAAYVQLLALRARFGGRQT
jgi:cellulose synthase/poly-beta-1,6-N-acetylglucosamine synthase-like glycosyltransferase